MLKNCSTLFSGIFALESEDKKEDKSMQEEALVKVAKAGNKIVRLTMLAGILYAVMTPVGAILGAIAAGIAVGYFDYGGWLVTGGSLLGFFLGGVIGFFTAQIVIAGMVEELLFSAGLKASGMGLQALRDLLKKATAKKTPMS